ncbi:MAG TPA: hypothetical protein VN666_00590 [Nitrospira sp.]|nr:hypothetical protein [Nitrospira sp.]
MKYDLAWRPRISYSDWKGRFLSPGMLQKLTTYDASLAEKLEYVDVIVQCVNPSSAYSQTFPELNDKPMLNFDKRLNRDMTLNKYYVSRRDLSAKLSIGKAELDSLSFAIVLNDTNPRHNSLKKCQEALSTERKQGRILDIDESFVVDNFVGDTNQNLIVMVGRYHAAKKN